jgi:hypothetical protein
MRLYRTYWKTRFKLNFQNLFGIQPFIAGYPYGDANSILHLDTVFLDFREMSDASANTMLSRKRESAYGHETINSTAMKIGW